MNGPRFFPSGRRFGPYFSSRLDASVAPRPFSVLVTSFFTTSSMGIAYQATISLVASAIVGSVMIGLSGQHGARLHTHIVRRVNIVTTVAVTDRTIATTPSNHRAMPKAKYPPSSESFL